MRRIWQFVLTSIIMTSLLFMSPSAMAAPTSRSPIKAAELADGVILNVQSSKAIKTKLVFDDCDPYNGNATLTRTLVITGSKKVKPRNVVLQILDSNSLDGVWSKPINRNISAEQPTRNKKGKWTVKVKVKKTFNVAEFRIVTSRFERHKPKGMTAAEWSRKLEKIAMTGDWEQTYLVCRYED